MRQFLISGLIIITTVSTASALDRYPKAKRYVNQSGEIIVIGQTPQTMAYAEVPARRALPAVKIAPIIEDVPVIQNEPAPRLVVVKAKARKGLFGPINVDPADWPSGRTCCRPGEAYFNENPDS